MLENDECSLMVGGDDVTDSAEAFNKNYESEPVEPEKPKQWALRDRLRSKVLWASVVGLIMTVFSAFNLWDRLGIAPDGFREFVAAVGAVMAAFGVFNDPTNREGF